MQPKLNLKNHSTFQAELSGELISKNTPYFLMRVSFLESPECLVYSLHVALKNLS